MRNDLIRICPICIALSLLLSQPSPARSATPPLAIEFIPDPDGSVVNIAGFPEAKVSFVVRGDDLYHNLRITDDMIRVWEDGEEVETLETDPDCNPCSFLIIADLDPAVEVGDLVATQFSRIDEWLGANDDWKVCGTTYADGDIAGSGEFCLSKDDSKSEKSVRKSFEQMVWKPRSVEPICVSDLISRHMGLIADKGTVIVVANWLGAAACRAEEYLPMPLLEEKRLPVFVIDLSNPPALYTSQEIAAQVVSTGGGLLCFHHPDCIDEDFPLRLRNLGYRDHEVTYASHLLRDNRPHSLILGIEFSPKGSPPIHIRSDEARFWLNGYDAPAESNLAEWVEWLNVCLFLLLFLAMLFAIFLARRKDRAS